MKFQRIFGAALPADTTLLHWYTCANDLQGVGMRQGVLYVTERFLCHHSNVVGNVVKEVIPIASITDLKKVNTALVIPNAIRIQTAQRTYYFRSFIDRAQSFRELVKLLPNKLLVSQEDDVDEKTRSIFRLEPSDTILNMHSANWHHDPGFTEGKVLFTTHHLLFVSNDDSFSRRRKIAWTDVRNIEKRKSFLIRNNAVNVITDGEGGGIFLSSSRWDRDKVVEEEMNVLWRDGQQALKSEASATSIDPPLNDSYQFADSRVRCRTMTCKVVEALKTPRSAALPAKPASSGAAHARVVTDASIEYERQLQRSRDALTFTVSVVDALTHGRGSDRKVGSPCFIELHTPWVLDNLTCSNMEVQLVDKTRSVIARAAISQGASRQVASVDLRRELRLRARVIRASLPSGTQYGPWSALVPVYSTQDLETETCLDVPDIFGEGSQEVVIETSQDSASCGFRICLYNRFWLLNLSGLRVDGKGRCPSRILPIGTPVGWDGGDELEVRAAGYTWSSPLPITDESEHHSTTGSTVALTAVGESVGIVHIRELNLEVSISAGVGRFDRTIVMTIAPVVVVENLLPDAEILVWQRSTPALPGLHREKSPRITLAAGETRPFHPEGVRKHCRLSVNLHMDGVDEICASFAPEVWWGRDVGGSGVGGGGLSSEPILLRLTSGRMVLLSSEMNRANTVVLRVRDTLGTVSHSIYNQSYFCLHFRQVGDALQRLLHVEPWQQEPLVWPEPTDLPHKLVLAKIDGIPVPRSAEVDCDDLLSLSAQLFQVGQLETLRSALEGGEVGVDCVPRQLAMGMPDGSAKAGGGQARMTTVRHDGRVLNMTKCQRGASMWHDRDGGNDRRHYRLRNLPPYLEGCILFQLPCYLSGVVEVSLASAATVYTFFVPSPRDGMLPAKLLAAGWQQEEIGGEKNYFDWDGQVGNPELDRFVSVFSKRYESAASFILPKHAGDTLMGLCVRATIAQAEGWVETSGRAAMATAGPVMSVLHDAEGPKPSNRQGSWQGARNILRLSDPEMHRCFELNQPHAVGAPPLLIELTGTEVILTGDLPTEAHGTDCKVVQVNHLAGQSSCLLRSTALGWVIAEPANGHGSSSRGVWVNNESVTSEIVLQNGDEIVIGTNAPGINRSEDEASGRRGEKGILYLFEDYCVHQQQRVDKASSLRSSTRLGSTGTKVMHVHVGRVLESAATRVPSKSQTTYSVSFYMYISRFICIYICNVRMFINMHERLYVITYIGVHI